MGLFKCKRGTEGRLDGKVAIITGANCGIGKVTARDFILRGAKVIIACRSQNKAEEAIADILAATEGQENVGEISFVQLDLSSLTSVRDAAQKILASEDEIHLLINNAGVMVCPYGKTEDGFETQFGVNHLGHFLFTCLLLPRIIRSAPARIVTVASSMYAVGKIDFNDLMWEKTEYSPTYAYGRSKLANILFTKELAERLKETGVTTYSLHPGAVDTELQRHVDDNSFFMGAQFVTNISKKLFFKTPEEGAQTTIHCAVDENAGSESGNYYSDRKKSCLMAKARDMDVAKRLWDESVQLVKLGDFDPFKKEETKDSSHL